MPSGFLRLSEQLLRKLELSISYHSQDHFFNYMFYLICSLVPPSGKVMNQTVCLSDVLDFLNHFAVYQIFLSYVDHKTALVQKKNAEFVVDKLQTKLFAFQMLTFLTTLSKTRTFHLIWSMNYMLICICSLVPPSGEILNQIVYLLDVLVFLNIFAEDSSFFFSYGSQDRACLKCSIFNAH